MTVKIARVIDFETTGTPDNENAEIIELGRIDVNLKTRAIGNPWQSFACPRGVIPPETKAVHHITEDEVRDAPQCRELWDQFYDGCDDDDFLVAHKADFERHFHPGDGRPWIDTYKVARVVWPDAPGHSVQALRYWLELKLDAERAMPPHRALPDAYVTAHIFARLLDHKTPEQMATISKFPALLKVMNFGKRKGTTFADAPLDYLEWIRTKSDLDEDTKFSARYWIRKRTEPNQVIIQNADRQAERAPAAAAAVASANADPSVNAVKTAFPGSRIVAVRTPAGAKQCST